MTLFFSILLFLCCVIRLSQHIAAKKVHFHSMYGTSEASKAPRNRLITAKPEKGKVQKKVDVQKKVKEIAEEANCLEHWFSSLPQMEIDGLGERRIQRLVKVRELHPVKLCA